MKKIPFSSIESIYVLSFPHHIDNYGELIVMEGNDIVPFNISRIFTVSSSKGSVRGKHAHKRCSQLMVCVSGSVDILCDDGTNNIKYTLDKPNIGLMVPPGIWAQQTYNYDNSSLIVLCDMPYDSTDYIHKMEDFYKLKNLK